MYVPGYGKAEAADIGSGVKGRFIDLGFDDWNFDDAGIARACWVAKADTVCRPRFATAPEKVMGSVNGTILGRACFVSFAQGTTRARTAWSIRSLHQPSPSRRFQKNVTLTAQSSHPANACR